MDSLIMFIVALFVYLVLLGINATQFSPKENIWLGISVPKEVLADPGMLALQAKYRRRYAQHAVLVLITLLPILLLGSKFSHVYLYFIFWMGAAIYVLSRPFQAAHYEAAKLKRQQGWYVGEKRVVQLDTKVSRLKGARRIAPYWFGIPLLCAAGLLLVATKQSASDAAVVYGAAGGYVLALTVAFFLIYRSYGKQKPRLYGGDSELNLQTNQAVMRYWSQFWLGVAIWESCLAAVAASYIAGQWNGLSQSGEWLSVAGFIGIATALPLLALLYLQSQIRRVEHEAFASGEASYVDEDEYWIGGWLYNNPNDRSISVPRRVGIGTTVNMANKTGRALFYGSIIVTAVLLLGIGGLMLQSDYTSPRMHLGNDMAVQVKYPFYNYSFQVQDIESIALVDEVPKGRRINGEATAAHIRGNFRLEGLGKAKLYVYRNNPPYVVIQLPELHIVYNEQDPAATRALHAELQALAAGQQ